ncbi:MAG: glycosyltransferase family A protein [Firmicutes bacterium]|nr:glycosyltransferase family 2 protein [Lachnospiraceae bacterium]MDD6065471.1 glycosyltransferase family A protein [Bacillota bacterium]MDY2819579.1 glycosyltransferase family A protein [Hominisplanchenecus sp.]
MKILSIAIPCYNSAAYMRRCIDSLLPGGDDVEILIVDDGSAKDDTAEIADEYEKNYPGIVRAIHQENGGHGEAVNAGLRNATGLYYKVVDSDDWVDEDAYLEIIRTLKELVAGPETVDMFISNFVYDKVGAKRKKVMRYGAFPENEIFHWEEAKKLHIGHYILMHSVIYRTMLLRECGLELPKHTFYVDNLFVFQPLPYVKNLYYRNLNFYHYFIGREDQSVNEQVMISRIDQQIRVNKIMIDTMAGRKIANKRLRQYMISYLDIITTISSVMLLRSGTEENLEKKKELWQYLKSKDTGLYLKLRHGIFGRTMNLPGKGGRKLSVAAYRITQKFYGFN